MTSVAQAKPLTVTRLELAIADFSARLSDDQRHELAKIRNVPDADSILVFTAQLDAANSDRRGRSVSTRVYTVLKSIQEVSDAIDTFVSSNPVIAALVWGSVKITLQVVVKFTSYFEAASTLLMHLGQLCPHFAEYGTLYQSSKSLQEALSDFYASIVRCCSHLITALHRPWRSQALKALYTSFEKEFQPDKDDIQHKSQNVKNVIDLAKDHIDAQERVLQAQERKAASTNRTMFQSFTARSISQNAYIQDLLLQQSKRDEQRRKEKLLNKLSTHRPEKSLKQNQRKRFCNTANWVFQTSEFRQWVGPGGSHIWLSGKIGSGKSVLVASIIDRLFLEKARSDYLVSYFFINSGDQDSLNAEAVMRSILRQRLPKPSEISDKLVTSLQTLEYDGDLEEIIDLLRTTTRSSRISYIVIDGLDRCKGAERSKLLKSLSSLAVSTSNTKLLLASRENLSTEIKRQFSSICRLSMSRAEAEGDITSCIDAFLKEKLENNHLKIGDSSLIDEIRQALIKGADGMLLWVFFQIQDICRQYSDDSIRKTIASLPKTLEETYHRLLRRIVSESHTQECQQVFAWVSGAMRPLSVAELREAIAIKIGQAYTEKDRLCNAMDRLISSCENLVHVDEEDQSVQFAHHSITQYLLKPSADRTRRKFYIDTDDNDHFIGEICMTYLDFNDFKTTLDRRQKPIILPKPLEIAASAMGPRWGKAVDIVNVIQAPKPSQPIDATNVVRPSGIESTVEAKHMKEAYPFLRYASVHWISHSKNFQPGISHTWDLLKRIIVRGHGMARLPWPSHYTISSFDLLEWALKSRHYALLRFIFWHSGHSPAKVSRTLNEAIYTGDEKLIDILILCYRNIEEEATENLVLAIQSGDLEIIEKLLLSGADVNAAARNGAHTALQAAAERGCLDVVERLLEANAKVNTYHSSPLGCTALQVAAKAGHFEVVEKLLAEDADVISLCGCTALQAASECGHLEIVQRLLAAPETFVNTNGTFVNTHDHGFNGRTALQLASEGGHLEVVRSLLAANANVNAPAGHTYGSYTALQAASRYGHLEVVNMLIEAGADVHAAAAKWGGRTALEAAAEGGNIDVLRTLLAAGARVNFCDTTPRAAIEGGYSNIATRLLEARSNLHSNNHAWLSSAVDTAACHGNLGFIKVLFMAGADANDGCALPIAARYGQLEVVRYLLAAKADVNAVHELQSTALIAAAENGHSDIVKELLKNGADPKINHNIRSSARVSAIGNGHFGLVNNGFTGCGTAIDAAAMNGHVDIVKILIESRTDDLSADYNLALQAAAENGHLDIVKILIENRVDVNTDTDYGTPLTAAATIGHIDIVKILLQNRADVNKVTERGTALSAAAGNGHLDIVGLLVGHQADVNKNTAHGTALASAASNGHLAVVNFLVKNGAIAEKDTNCSVALSIAANNKNFDIVKILLQNGATIHQDADRGIALLAAVANGDLDIIDRLIRAGANVNAESSRGTALRAAVRDNASLEIIDRLINAGASVNAEDENSYTALDMARLNSRKDHYKRLKQAGGKKGAWTKKKSSEGKTTNPVGQST
ncbi:ankyrin repeat-containing domain protein [Xylaria digitata]|nr:ankyrin repeat-containing domain protein [Xylaria digitata]